MVHNCKYSSLSLKFGISQSSVSKILYEILPILVDYFQNFIPNRSLNHQTSNMSSLISFVIDGTIHWINRRYPQKLYWRNDKAKHFVQQFFL